MLEFVNIEGKKSKKIELVKIFTIHNTDPHNYVNRLVIVKINEV